ncbi:MAG: DUF1574 domain-containing protein [Leptospiraceae bacterium]|nr:DUF1574 family protein [Leptospiraceae bacterium]MCK6380176.1 DUF1574 domain-containing protein [Leptospiraceae bacterium]NUM41206.1 DUF1574 family protein [Leptospiraceae bacterium]
MKKFQIQIFIILFIILEKLILIPVIKYNITLANKNNPYIETLENLESPYFEMMKKTNRKILWSFGTSRSFPFYFLPVDKTSDVDKYLLPKEKFELKKWEFFTFSALGSNPAIYYTRFLQLLERGLLPEKIVLEVSPFSFNKNNLYNKTTQTEGIPLDLAMKNFLDFPLSYTSEIIYSRVFATARYKISIKKMKNIWDKKNTEIDLDYFFKIALQKKEKTNKLYSDLDYEDINLENKKPPTEDIRFTKMVDLIDEYFYKNWKLDESQIYFLEKIIERSKQRNIPVILWRPKVYEEGKNSYKKFKVENVFQEEMKRISKKFSIPYMDFNESNLSKCNYFRDASHLSPRCYTELGYQLTKLSQ